MNGWPQEKFTLNLPQPGFWFPGLLTNVECFLLGTVLHVLYELAHFSPFTNSVKNGNSISIFPDMKTARESVLIAPVTY